MRYCLWFLIVLVGINAFAGPSFVREYRFGTEVSETEWKSSGDTFVCKLSHNITDYGRATFFTRAGHATLFELNSFQGLPTMARGKLSAMPPPWRHDAIVKDLGQYKLNAGNTVLQLNQVQTQNVLSILSSGYILRLIYDIKVLGRERITVDVSSVGWQQAFIQYNECLDKLLPYDFEDIRRLDIYFASNSEDLTVAARRKLQKIIQYIRSGAKISKIVLRGYTDNIGSYNHNRRLAGRRSNAVKTFLVSNGVKAKAIEIKDIFGKYRLVTKGKQGRRVNVELQN